LWLKGNKQTLHPETIFRLLLNHTGRTVSVGNR
jgi:hypothetical protein